MPGFGWYYGTLFGPISAAWMTVYYAVAIPGQALGLGIDLFKQMQQDYFYTYGMYDTQPDWSYFYNIMGYQIYDWMLCIALTIISQVPIFSALVNWFLVAQILLLEERITDLLRGEEPEGDIFWDDYIL